MAALWVDLTSPGAIMNLDARPGQLARCASGCCARMGEIAATLLSRMAVPVVYYLIARRGRADELRAQGLGPAVSA